MLGIYFGCENGIRSTGGSVCGFLQVAVEKIRALVQLIFDAVISFFGYDRSATLPRVLPASGSASSSPYFNALIRDLESRRFASISELGHARVAALNAHQLDIYISPLISFFYQRPFLGSAPMREGEQRAARWVHGRLHAARTVLWTILFQSLSNNPSGVLHMPLAIAAALHDSARQGEGVDLWDSDSAALTRCVLSKLGFDEDVCQIYSDAIAQKDEETDSPIQHFVHDADCLDIIRVFGDRFQPAYLICQSEKLYQLLPEARAFILETEQRAFHNEMECVEENLFSRLLERVHRKGKDGRCIYPQLSDLFSKIL